MVNAHPVILCQLLRRQFPDNPEYWMYQQKYWDDREIYIKEVVDTHGVPRGDAKQLFITLINEGSYTGWKAQAQHIPCCGGKKKKECNKKYDKKDPSLGDKVALSFVQNYEQEIKRVIPLITRENPDLVEAVKKEKEKNRTKFKGGQVMSVFLGNYERIILETVIKYFQSRGFIEGNNCVQAFDGFMSPIDLVNQDDVPQILVGIQEHVESVTGFKIEWDTKAFDQAYTEEELEPFEFECTNTWSKDYMNSLEGYERKKNYFELFFTKIEKPTPRIVRADKSYKKDEDGNINCFMTFTELGSVKGLLSNVTSGNAKKGPVSFESEWVSDPIMNTAHRLGNFPYNGTYDESKRFMKIGEEVILNVFQGYSNLIRTPFDNRDQLIAPWIALTRALCEGDNPDTELREKCFKFHRNVLAKKIQNPTSKIGFLVILEGKTRTGKNVHMKPIGTLLGEEQYMITSKLGDVVGEHATLWVGKLLVVINECQMKKKDEDADGILKSHITDIEQTVNPKGKTMYRIEDYAQYCAFTNKENPVPMDVNSGDGKIVSFHCGEEFRSRTGKFWGGMVKHFERPDFIAALYDYLNSVDLTGYDFKVERQHILTDSYRRLVEANIPFVARSLVYLLRRMLTESCEVDGYGDIIFFQPFDAPKRSPSGDVKVKHISRMGKTLPALEKGM
eukprot:g7756.t1